MQLDTWHLTNRTTTDNVDIWTAINTVHHEVWTAIICPDGHETIITPTGGHVQPHESEYHRTQEFIAWIIETSTF